MTLLEEMDQYSQRLGRDRRGHMESSHRFAILRCYCHLIDQINTFSQTLGKDGKFQLFVCLSARYSFLILFPLFLLLSSIRQFLTWVLIFVENNYCIRCCVQWARHEAQWKCTKSFPFSETQRCSRSSFKFSSLSVNFTLFLKKVSLMEFPVSVNSWIFR